MALTWSTRSLSEIDRTAEYIAKDSPRHAEFFVQRIFRLGEIIARNPWIGRIVPEFDKKELREMILGKSRVIYQVTDPGNIMIVTVHYGPAPLEKI